MSAAHHLLPRGTRLFMTGGTGFVGRSLLRAVLDPSSRFAAGDLHITVLSRSPERFLAEHRVLAADKRIEWIQGDVRSFVAPQERYTHVIHAATDTSVAAAQRPLELIDVIVSGTRRVLDFAARCEAQKVVFTSSGSVYGSQPAQVERLEESFCGAPDTSDPASASGQAKRLAEQLCSIAFHESGLPVKVARLFAFIGEELPLDAHFAIGNFIRDALAGRPIEVQGDGSPVRTYLYGGDLAVWLLTILERGRPNRAYNVGSDEAISIADLAQRVADHVAPGAPVRIAGRRADYAGRLRYVPSIERAKADLGLRVDTPLDEAIRRTAAWHRRI